MKRLILFLFLASTLFATDNDWKVGFNFRATSSYVTDGADEVYVLMETSSTTRSTANGHSATFLWDIAGAARDRASDQDVRLAGYNGYGGPGAIATLTITLPQAGTYKVRIALGDHDYSDNEHAEIYDDTSLLLTVDAASVPANSFVDANSDTLTAANWPGSNTSKDLTFTTTTCKVVTGQVSPSAEGKLAHLYLEYVPPAGGARKRVMVVQ